MKTSLILLVVAALLSEGQAAKYFAVTLNQSPLLWLNYSFDAVPNSLWGTVQTNQAGWVAFGITQSSGNMVPSRVWMFVPNSVLEAVVTSKHASSFSFQTAPNLVSYSASPVRTFVFTRPLAANGFTLDPSGTSDLIWAWGENDDVATEHRSKNRGSGSLNWATGVLLPNSGISLRQVHGILMAIVWLLVFPLGILFVRYSSKESSGNVSNHFGFQAIGFAILIAGFGIAIQMTKEANNNHFAGKHQIFGLILFILTSLSFIGALFRKFLPSYNVWRLGHRVLGWLLLVWSMVCVFTGLNAYGSAGLFTGLVAGAIGIYAILTVFLECKKRKDGNGSKD